MSDDRDRYHAAVVGGGPAGAAAALALARAGRRVVLIEGEAGEFARAGESLAPAARPLLRDLGLLDRLAADGHRPCFGNVSVWGSGAPQASDFLFNPYGHGWQLDRRRFDAMLRDAAGDAGAHILAGRSVHARRSGGRWAIEVDRTLSVEWLVDASGRRAAIATRHGAIRLRDDALVAFHARFRPASGVCDDRDARTVVEATPVGWWYSTLVTDGDRVVAYLTDADLADGVVRAIDGFAERLREAGHLRGLLHGHGYVIVGRPRGADAGGARLDRVAGDGWIAAGDAAMAFDPLASQGLLFALDSGTRAGLVVDRALAGDPGPLSEYPRHLDAIRAAYRRDLAACYAAERRWSDRPFWRRRAPV